MLVLGIGKGARMQTTTSRGKQVFNQYSYNCQHEQTRLRLPFAAARLVINSRTRRSESHEFSCRAALMTTRFPQQNSAVVPASPWRKRPVLKLCFFPKVLSFWQELQLRYALLNLTIHVGLFLLCDPFPLPSRGRLETASLERRAKGRLETAPVFFLIIFFSQCGKVS